MNKEKTLSEQSIQLGRLMMKERMRYQAELGREKNAARRRLLGIIQAHPDLTEGELCYTLGRRVKEPEEYLEKLIRKGYLVRGQEGAISLTDKGREEAASFDGLDTLFDCLEESEQQELQGYFARVLRELEERLDSRDDDDLDFHGAFGPMGDSMFWGHGPHGRGRCHKGYDPRGDLVFADFYRGF